MHGRRGLLVALLAVAALALAACGGDDDVASPSDTSPALADQPDAPTPAVDPGETGVTPGERALSVDLEEQNDSGRSGQASIRATGDTVEVLIDLGAGADQPQPAHIHSGTCADLGGVVHPLANVSEDGTSQTAVDVSLDELREGEFAINVHESEEAIETYVACGDITDADTG